MKLVIEESGLPPGVVNVVTGYGAVVGEPLVTHPKVAKVAFTGGTATGARVNELAAKTFKKVSLELGGKSPNIVFDDCILDDAVSGAVSGIFAATGQTCIAGSRLLLQETIHDQFVEKLVAMAKTARLGDPGLPETQVGPVTTPPQYQKILGYIDIAKGEGAKCVLGGGPATKEEGGGKYFVKPTIFTGVDNKMRIAQEEVFGPVLSVIKFKDEDDAVRIANDIAYGLGAGVWTQSVRRAHTMARKIKAGTVWVNTYRAVSFLMPFGGYKASGLGRENGAEAIEGYLQSKSVWINNGPGGGNPFVMKTASSRTFLPPIPPCGEAEGAYRSWQALGGIASTVTSRPLRRMRRATRLSMRVPSSTRAMSSMPVTISWSTPTITSSARARRRRLACPEKTSTTRTPASCVRPVATLIRCGS